MAESGKAKLEFRMAGVVEKKEHLERETLNFESKLIR